MFEEAARVPINTSESESDFLGEYEQHLQDMSKQQQQRQKPQPQQPPQQQHLMNYITVQLRYFSFIILFLFILFLVAYFY